MSDLRPRGVPIELDGVERHLLFTLNTIDDLQDKYGKNMLEILNDIVKKNDTEHTLRDTVTFLLNAEADRLDREELRVTERDVGDLIGMDNYKDVLKAVLEAYGISMPEPEEGEDPNGKSAQRSS